nr:MAG TPA: hypothetical protein [Caudoviricetes sp.]
MLKQKMAKYDGNNQRIRHILHLYKQDTFGMRNG